MSTFGETRRDPPTWVAAVSGRARALHGCAGRTALAGLIAGSILLGPVASAAAQNGQAEAKQGQAAATPTSGGRPKKVSPYAIAARRHMHAAAEAGDRAKQAAPARASLHSARFRKE